MSAAKNHYEPRPGVNSVRIGSLFIGPRGHTAANHAEDELLAGHPDIQVAKPAANPKEEKTP